MKNIHIFKAGTHTSAAGQTLDFSEDLLRKAAEVYDPSLHEAPIVVGHPKDNGPAYGWVSSVEYSEEGLHANPIQVDADFAEMVTAGRFKKVSASFYSPDSPANPSPGNYYLRHVGFLGAQPPAIKGLKGVEFNEAEEGVVEFSGEWETASFFRRFREWFIDKFSREEADEVIPSWVVESMEDAARNPKETIAEPGFAEPDPDEVDDMDKEQLAAAQKKLDDDRAAFESQQAEFSERQNKLQAQEAEAHRKTVAAKVSALVDAGKILPADQQGLTDFAANLNAEQVVEFGEGDDSKQDASKWLFGFLDKLPKQVDFNEHSADDKSGDGKDLTSEQLSQKAIEFQEEQRSKGITVSITQAVNEVKKQLAG